MKISSLGGSREFGLESLISNQGHSGGVGDAYEQGSNELCWLAWIYWDGQKRKPAGVAW